MGARGLAELSGPADRARRLFRYLSKLAELRSKTVRDVSDYEHVIWLSDLPEEATASTVFQDEPVGTTDDSWLDMDRITLPPPPSPPDDLAPWIETASLDRSDLDEPRLVGLDTVDGDYPPEILSSYRQYLVERWQPWATKHRELKRNFDFYRDLFSMSERRQRLGEVYEIVVGLGFLTWALPRAVVRRHLITTPVEIIVDAGTGRISVVPSSAEGKNRFELDMLEADTRGNPAALEELVEQIEEADPLDLPDITLDVLSRWLNQAHASGTVDDSLVTGRPTSEPHISLAPAFILRKRGQRTLAQLLGDVADSIERGEDLAPGVARLVSGEPTDGTAARTLGFDDPEIYFPLPANEEQLQIVRRMGSDHGILVQGPPGTGKSHTIANLISHLLAQGKRVLVTSHTDRALRVLHGKLPDEIKPLCISILGSDRQSIRVLEGAVEQITARQSDWSDVEVDARIDEARAALQTARERLQAAAVELRQIRESETLPVSLGSYHGTRQHIAAELARDRERFGWIFDEVADESPPLSDEEFSALIELLDRIDEQAEAAARADLPDPEQLLAPQRLEELGKRERELEGEYRRALEVFGSWLSHLRDADTATVQDARNLVETWARHLDSNSEGWPAEAIRDVVHDNLAVWETLAENAEAAQDEAEQALGDVADATIHVSLDEPVDVLRARTEELLAHAREGGRLKPGLFAASVVRHNRDLLENVTVAGKPPTSEQDLFLLARWLDLNAAIERLRREWGTRIDVPPDLSTPQQVAFFAEQLRRLRSLVESRSVLAAARDAVARLDSLEIRDWADHEAVRQVARAIQAHLDYRRIEAIRKEVAAALEAVGQDPHPVSAALRDAIDTRDGERYRRAIADLAEQRRRAAEVREARRMLGRLQAAAPDLAGRLADDPLTFRDRSLARAWAWRFADTSLERMLDPKRATRLEADIDKLRRSEKRLLTALAADLAWKRMFGALTTEHSEALKAWAVAIKKVGKGTGKYAPRYRRAARRYMEQARDAIPAWIMPMYRVADSLTPAPEAFDVVIVDEASQSGVESLFLFHLGKQVIVVGDDQQIAPEGVGLDRSNVHALQAQYIADLDLRELLEPTNSLFDQAKIYFRGAIALREHFRCMPEIIEFCNRIAYATRTLIPLRQYGADRLDPIKTVYLPHGYREGDRQAINRPEATEIVERIAKLYTDPRYDGKTIGVVSLQGEAQARLIEQMLVERIGPQQMLERHIVCGDAYAFQGDERDVMFLSMVAAPNTRIGPLAKEEDKRRFNVAASRARDQVWLIHSVRPEDLSESDMRRTMLEYYLDPQVDHLEELEDRDWSVVDHPFESKFEQDVYLELRRRGFRVAPQVAVAGYRIDLVVEGADGRLAVECDGDEWHGPDRWEADMARQRQLERCGWQFVRIRGSEYYRDPDAALARLWKALETRGIKPGGYSSFDRWQIRETPITGPESGSPTLDTPAPPGDTPDGLQREAPAESQPGGEDGAAEPLGSDPSDSDDEPAAEGTLVPDVTTEAPPVEVEAVATATGSEETPDGPSETDTGAAPPPEQPDPVPSWVTLGTRILHPVKGTGRITAVANRHRGTFDVTKPVARIRFDDGSVADYTAAQLEHEGIWPAAT